MPPPLGAGGIMFSGCPSVRLSVRPSMDMKNYLRTQITLYEEDKNYPIWRRQERRSKYAVQLASWQLRSNSPKTTVRLSVRSLKYPLLTCTWVRWSTRPTVTVLRHVRPSARPSVCPSVRPERFPDICRRMHGGISLKFYMLMYLDHLQNWLVYGHGLLVFLILALFWLSETGQIWGFRAFPGERTKGIAWNFARWCILTTFRTD